MPDPIQEGIDIGQLIVLAAIAFAAWWVYNDWGSGSGTSSALCNSVGVSCGSATPTGGLGAWAQSIGSWWGTASVAVDNANQKADQATTTINDSILSVGSLVTPAPPTPAAPTLGLPAGYNVATGTIQ